MIKSDKEMKNNSVCDTNLLKPPGLAVLSERERYALGRFEPKSKVKIQVRCDLHLKGEI